MRKGRTSGGGYVLHHSNGAHETRNCDAHASATQAISRSTKEGGVRGVVRVASLRRRQLSEDVPCVFSYIGTYKTAPQCTVFAAPLAAAPHSFSFIPPLFSPIPRLCFSTPHETTSTHHHPHCCCSCSVLSSLRAISNQKHEAA